MSYRPFPTVATCLASGGELPRNLRRSGKARMGFTAPLPGSGGYKRSHFGHGWDDVDGDCQDSRAEALIATSTTTVRFADDRRCRVLTGRWISPFTGKVIQNAPDIDIDHVVPLAWAWARGAARWPAADRAAFANNPVNLWPVEAHLNRSKGARGPDQWLPPSRQCQYIARFVRITKRYQLQPTSVESQRFQRLLAQCAARQRDGVAAKKRDAEASL